MKINSREEILELLSMPDHLFREQVTPMAAEKAEKTLHRTLRVTAMMGYTNICKNNCLYCGMRAGNAGLKRYRIEPEKVKDCFLEAAGQGYGRAFLIAGEDPKYGFENLLSIVSALKERGMYISLACGEYEKKRYEELADAGVDEYVLKFEMSDPKSFNRLNPSTTFEKRMQAIETIRGLGMKLASGNIVDWPGQTAEELAEDLMLMKKLEISWAPIIPYLPAVGTPLAQEGGRGRLPVLYKEISLLRLMMPEVHITAQQPGNDPRKGLADPEGNLEAVRAGADLLFFDLLPEAQARDFRVIDNRRISGPGHVFQLAEACGYAIDTGKELVQ